MFHIKGKKKSQQLSSSWREKLEKKKLLLDITLCCWIIKYDLWSKLAKEERHYTIQHTIAGGSARNGYRK